MLHNGLLLCVLPGERLQNASISLLAIGSLPFVSAICMILFEEQWVAQIVSKFPNHPEEKEGAKKETHAAEAEIDPKDTMRSNDIDVEEDQDADDTEKDKEAVVSAVEEGNSDLQEV